MLTFLEKPHEYYWDGVRVPGVTSVLDPICEYSGVPRHILDRAAARGTYVHKMCEYYLWGTLDEASVDSEHLPYLDAFRLFLQESQFQAEFIEEKVYHHKLKYAGALDLGGTLPGKRGKTQRALIDIKTTFKLMRSVGPQLAAYKDAWESDTSKDLHFDTRWGLQLKPTGEYKLQLYDNINDMNIFKSCLNIHNFMKKEEN
jgi:hypothetical protein